MILFSDLHLREESAEIVLQEVLPGIQSACEAHKDVHVGFLGDFFHLRYQVNVRLFNAVRDMFIAWGKAGISVRMIPGNHDQVDLQGRNALESYGDLDNVSVYTDPTWDEFGLWIPYRKVNGEVAQAALLKKPAKSPKVLFLHHGMSGAFMNDHYRNTDGLLPDAFGSFDYVFCGHYHKRQQLRGNVWYIGSPYQTRADEASQPKGYAVWDGESIQFVDMEWGPRYHTIILKKGDSLDVSGIRKNDIVRVKTSGVSVAAVTKELMELGVSHTIIPESEQIESRLDVRPDAGLDQYIQAYMDQQQSDLSSTRLLEVYETIRGN